MFQIEISRLGAAERGCEQDSEDGDGGQGPGGICANQKSEGNKPQCRARASHEQLVLIEIASTRDDHTKDGDG